MFSLNPQSGTPIYRQLMEQIRRMVSSAQLRPGDELPSVRELAMTHAVNPMTISKAFSQLEQQGVLERRKGIGMLVAEQHNISNYSESLLAKRDEFIQLAKQNQLSDDAIITLIQDALSALSNRT